LTAVSARVRCPRLQSGAGRRVSQPPLPIRGGRFLSALLALAAALAPRSLGAQPPAARPIDRVVVVFESPETGGGASPQIVFERELAFAARLEALAAGEPLDDETGPYAQRHVRAALDRYVATTILGALPVERNARLTPHPCDGTGARADVADLTRRLTLARAALAARAHGDPALRHAAAVEGLDQEDLAHFVRREALAARYLDVMVAPMLAPSDDEVRAFLRNLGAPRAPEGGLPSIAAPDLCAVRHAFVAQRLGAALVDFWQSVRQRVRVRVVPPP
jgi:hypothetical protein